MGNHGFFGQIQDWVRIYNNDFGGIKLTTHHGSWRHELWGIRKSKDATVRTMSTTIHSNRVLVRTDHMSCSNPRFCRIFDKKSGVRTRAGTENVTF